MTVATAENTCFLGFALSRRALRSTCGRARPRTTRRVRTRRERAPSDAPTPFHPVRDATYPVSGRPRRPPSHPVTPRGASPDASPSSRVPGRRMKTVSLFSGIGGLDLGLEDAGHEIIMQVESDPHCVQASAPPLSPPEPFRRCSPWSVLKTTTTQLPRPLAGPPAPLPRPRASQGRRGRLRPPPRDGTPRRGFPVPGARRLVPSRTTTARPRSEFSSARTGPSGPLPRAPRPP